MRQAVEMPQQINTPGNLSWIVETHLLEGNYNSINFPLNSTHIPGYMHMIMCAYIHTETHTMNETTVLKKSKLFGGIKNMLVGWMKTVRK